MERRRRVLLGSSQLPSPTAFLSTRDIAVGLDSGYALQESIHRVPGVGGESHRHGEPLMAEPIALEVFTDFV
jgi:hypothetical protein